jgi:[ribosomal protein S5]-alanine N-acetyltransferase
MVSNISPFPELTTKRLVLREINTADAPLIHEMRSDNVTNALIDRENSGGIEDALLFISRIKNNVERNESIYWVICFKNTSGLIGTICYWNFDLLAETAEIGYELLAGFRNQGIMSEVLPRVIQFGFEEMKLKSITAFTSEQNTSSVKLLEKFGFSLTSSGYDNTHQDVPGMLTFVLTSPLT